MRDTKPVLARTFASDFQRLQHRCENRRARVEGRVRVLEDDLPGAAGLPESFRERPATSIPS